jgi:hypothetical protein
MVSTAMMWWFFFSTTIPHNEQGRRRNRLKVCFYVYRDACAVG